ncbi:MAG: hypothetical protein EXX96DRAFT_448978, partial [Benjaminiella poitrasii]
ISCYIIIDSKILCQNILGRRWISNTDKLAIWAELVNLRVKPFKDQEDDELNFCRTIQSDGMGVSTLKK